MTLEQIGESIPEYAKDLKLNLSSLQNQPELTTSQCWGTFVACAAGVGDSELLTAVEVTCGDKLSSTERDAAKGAAALMGMNNIYYRFTHLVSNESYRTMPARLRMNFLRSHGVASADFELWSLAVSAINGCGMCIDSHERKLREEGISAEAIVAAVRIASVIHAVAVVRQSGI